MHKEGKGGGGKTLEILTYKWNMKQGTPPDFVTAPSTPLKRILQKPTGPPPGFPNTVSMGEGG